MTEHVKPWFEEFKNGAAKVSEHAPDAIKGFGGMFTRIMKDGAISLKTKELIAVSIGVAMKCEPCIRLHVQKSLDAGCTKEEIIEAASVAIMMGGGPAYTHMPIVIETVEALQG